MKDDRLQDIAVACDEISQQIVRKSQAIADKLRLSPSDFSCLSLLFRGGPMTAGQLAKMTSLTTGAITGVVDRLEDAGLAKRQHDKLDRRRIIVVPTKRAIKELQSFNKKSAKDFAECLSNYSSAELTVILAFLRTTTEALRQETELLHR